MLAEGTSSPTRSPRPAPHGWSTPRDVEATARALDELLGDREALAAARAACAALATEFLWPNLLAPLVDQVEAAEPASRSVSQDAALAFESARYYAARAVDRGVQGLPSGLSRLRR